MVSKGTIVVVQRRESSLTHYKGYNGQMLLDLDAQTLTVTRDGLIAKGVPGRRAERVIPLAAVSDVRLIEASRLRNGNVAIATGGAKAPELGKDAMHADAVSFMYKSRETFADLYSVLLGVVANNKIAGFQAEPPSAELAEKDAAKAEKDSVKAAARSAKGDALVAKVAARSAAKLQNANDRYSGGGSRPDIAEAAARMSWTFGGKRELKKLVEHVQDDEVVSFIAQGTYQTNQGIVVLTDQRLLFVFYGFASAVVEDFPLRSITSVASKKGIGSGTLIVHVAGAATHITSVINSDLGHILDALRLAVKAGQNPQQVLMHQAPAAIDVADQLGKLAALRDRGILSDDEFAAQKAKLLT